MKVGKIAESVLKRSVLKQIKYRRQEVVNGAGVGEDCAVFSSAPGDRTAIAVQSGVVHTLLELNCLIHRCLNNLAAGSAEPVAAMLGMTLPASAEETLLKELMAQAECVLSAQRVQIAGGHTAVSEAVTAPVVTVTAYGRMPEDRVKGADRAACPEEGRKTGSGVNSREASGSGRAAPGEDIVLSKWIGLEGTARLAERYEEGLLTRYPAYFIREARAFERYLSVLPEAAVAQEAKVCAMHDASGGGILAALWELCERSGVGLTVDLKKLPIRQETVEVCERLGVNPYELACGGCMVMTAQDGEALVSALKKAGIPAAVIGKITDSNDRLILNEDEVRYMDRPRADEMDNV